VYPKSNGAFNANSCYTLRVQTGTASKFEENNVITLNNIRLYPNPVDNMLTVDLGNSSDGATIKVYDMNGMIVLSKPAIPDQPAFNNQTFIRSLFCQGY
jgi:hypothetical protein